MIGKRLRRLRLARGLSLEALAAELEGMVTKQALSKYETGKATPSPAVLARLAFTFGVKAAELFTEPEIEVEFPGYRKQAKLSRKEQERMESIITEEMQRRVRLQKLIGDDKVTLPIQQFRVSELTDVENAATDLRAKWDLGREPISHVIETLENHGVHVVEVDAPRGFDGISAIVRDSDGTHVAAGAVTRKSISGERQRFNVAHELGHLVLSIADECDKESAAHRFAAAFLAPAESIRREVGRRRATVQLDELKYMRRRFGISMQASLRRLKDLDIISDASYREWCINFSRWGWRKQEPGESINEEPQWLRRTVLRALSEGLMTTVEAEAMIDEKVAVDVPLALLEKRNFMKLPIEERRRLLEQQAMHVAEDYDQSADDDVIGGGGIIDDY